MELEVSVRAFDAALWLVGLKKFGYGFALLLLSEDKR